MARFVPLVEVRVDASEIDRLARGVGELAAASRDKATVRAINHVGNKGFTAVRRATARQAGLKVGDAGKAMRKELASTSAPIYRIIGRGAHLPAFKFGGRQTRRGASAAPWKKRRVFPGTFVARMGTGHVGIFRRTGSKRLPVRELWGPSIPVEMIRDDAKTTFERLVDSELLPRLGHELAREVDRIKAKYGL
ncbi:phage tail protein [Microbaculum marinisediminis]|uniref:Phage tail protein n=1 Tax=Microbaculum marinisediminis TaxID=2931392 RepID=A0AAW5QR85_9HYPH|nr:phage tail protein [Microbaculum sp. A6E488]MCT8970596.1 phage tail protein [Microbaculum sp. A6E488]